MEITRPGEAHEGGVDECSQSRDHKHRQRLGGQPPAKAPPSRPPEGIHEY